MSIRILLLGVTGVDKINALNALIDWRREEFGQPNLEIIDFEKEYIEPIAKDLYSYLDGLEIYQNNYWEKAWAKFKERLPSLEGKDIVLTLHGTLVRPSYGVRSPIIINYLKDFEPTAIITLIDDVYTMWYKTERRANGLNYLGRPTLEQLISGRRLEIFLGDFIARNLSLNKALDHYVIAVRHPVRTLSRLLIHPKICRIYWSFPISEPRRMEADGDLSGINDINNFLKQASSFERENHCVCFCPLTIDELPLTLFLNDLNTEDDLIQFHTTKRWDVKSFYPKEEKLLLSEDSIPAIINLPKEQVGDIRGMIPTDIRTRDYRLIGQSTRMVVFNPILNGKRSNGVRNEIACAIQNSVPIFIYQDPKNDPKSLLLQYIDKSNDSGPFPSQQGSEYISVYDTIPELFENLKNHLLN